MKRGSVDRARKVPRRLYFWVGLRLLRLPLSARATPALRDDPTDLRGDILEVGAGAGAMFSYYGEGANVVALEPDDDFRAAAEEAAHNARASIQVVGGAGESLPFPDASFDAIVASTVLCSVTSMEQTLAEFKRVLKRGGRLRLLEHVRSEHWPEGLLMDILNPVWLRLGCNWNRRTVEAVRNGGFQIDDVEAHKFFSPAAPATFPLRLIKARGPSRS